MVKTFKDTFMTISSIVIKIKMGNLNSIAELSINLQILLFMRNQESRVKRIRGFLKS